MNDGNEESEFHFCRRHRGSVDLFIFLSRRVEEGAPCPRTPQGIEALRITHSLLAGRGKKRGRERETSHTRTVHSPQMPPASSSPPPSSPLPLALDPSIAAAVAGRRGGSGRTDASAAGPHPPPPPDGALAALRYDFMPDSLQRKKGGGGNGGGGGGGPSRQQHRGALTLDADGRVELVRASVGGGGGGGEAAGRAAAVLFAGRCDLALPALGGLLGGRGGGGGGGGAPPTASSHHQPPTTASAGDLVDCVAVFEGGQWTLHALTGGAASLR
jgi:hypothetical protein